MTSSNFRDPRSATPAAGPESRRGIAAAGLIGTELVAVTCVLAALTAVLLAGVAPPEAESAAAVSHEFPVREVVTVGGRFATLYDDRCLVRDVAGSPPAAVWIRRGDERVASICGSPAAARLAVVHFDGSVRMLDGETFEPVWTRSTGLPAVRSTAFSADGRFVAVGTESGAVAVLDAVTGDKVRRSEMGRDVETVAFSPDGDRLAAAAANGDVLVTATRDGRELARFRPSPSQVVALRFDDDGRRLAGGTTAGAVFLWDAETGRVAVAPETHSVATMSVAFLPDGRLATGGVEGPIKVLDGRLEQVAEFVGHTRGVRALAMVGSTFVSGGHDGTVRFWDPATGAERSRFGVR